MSPTTELSKGAPAAPSRHRRFLLRCAGALAIILLLLLAAGMLIARKLQPMLRARLLQTFQERFHSPAHIDALSVRYDGMLQVDGRGLSVQSVLNGVPGDPHRPMLQVGEFHFRVGLLQALSRSPRIHHVRIRGVQLVLPPDQAAHASAPLPAHEVDLEYAEVDDAHIRFLSNAPDRAPLQFDLPHLQFRGVSRSHPIRFHAVVDNGPPLGITTTDGTVGPWNFDDPRQTPIQGTFAFVDKDVSSVPGLRGELSLDGRYRGTVGNMHAEGTTSDPAFALDSSSHPVQFRTSFSIDLRPAASGIEIERLQGNFDNTTFQCSGTAIKDGPTGSFRLDLHVETISARVEDVLGLASRVSPPVLRGALAFQGTMRMSPGPRSIADKLQLEPAAFRLSGAALGSPAAQQSFEQLSERAQGEPKDATPGRASHASAEIRGTVAMRGPLLTVSNVHVAAPGSDSLLHGTYALRSGSYALDGEVHTSAKLSHMTTGLKSLLLKPFDGHFRHAGRTSLPLHIHGKGGEAHVSTSVAGLRIKAPGTD